MDKGSDVGCFGVLFILAFCAFTVYLMCMCLIMGV